MPVANVFDNTFPPDTQQANLLGQDIRTFKLDMQQRMGAISGLAADIWNPALDVQPTQWTGLLYFATDTGHIFQWSGSAWVDVTASLIPPPSSGGQNIFDVTQNVFTNPAVATVLNTITIPAASLRVGSRIDLLSGFTISGGTPTIQLVTASGTIALGTTGGSFDGTIKATFFVVDPTHAALFFELGQTGNITCGAALTEGFIIANALTLSTQVAAFTGTIHSAGLSAVVTF